MEAIFLKKDAFKIVNLKDYFFIIRIENWKRVTKAAESHEGCC